MNLLVVDDEYYIVKGIVSSIRRDVLGIDEIFTAYSADQARKVIEKEVIDLLITDIEMPRGSGLELIEWLQTQDRHILTLILTGHPRFDYAQKAVMMHCFSYLLKPVDPRTLEQELRRALAAHSSGRSAATGSGSDASEASAPGSGISVAGLAGGADDFTEKVRRYIVQNLASPELNRNSIAAHMHMNPDYLSYLFHARFRQTLSAYITAARIDKAKELLWNSSLSLNEISEQIGFSSSSYFHRQFKKLTGQTPQQYRGARKP